MQFSPSTASADPSLASLLFPAAGGTAAAVALPPGTAEAEAFETLFAGLNPAAVLPMPTAVAPATAGSAPAAAVPPPPAAPLHGSAVWTAPAAAPLPQPLRPEAAVVAAPMAPTTPKVGAKPVPAGVGPGIETAPADEAIAEPTAKTIPTVDPKIAAEAMALFLPLPLVADITVEEIPEAIETDENAPESDDEESVAAREEDDSSEPAGEIPTAGTRSGRAAWETGAGERSPPAYTAFESEAATAVPDSATATAVAAPASRRRAVRDAAPAPEVPVLANSDTFTRALPNARAADFLPVRDIVRTSMPLSSGGHTAANSAQAVAAAGEGIDLAAWTAVAGPATPVALFPRSAPVAAPGSAPDSSLPEASLDVPAASPGFAVRLSVEPATIRPESGSVQPPLENGKTDTLSLSRDPRADLPAAVESAAVALAVPAPRREPGRASRSEPTLPFAASDVRPAILAAPREFRAEAPATAESTADKNFLTADGMPVAKGQEALGTAVAIRELAMYSRSTPPLPTHPASGYEAAAVNVGLDSASVAEAALPAPAPQVVASPHRAVEAVLTAVDRAAGQTQSAVKLDFAIGQESLAVRVELQDGEVRATFRTDSPELRAALAQEWQQVAGSGDRTVKLAPAVFTSADSDSPTGNSGDGASRQQERQVWREEAQQQQQVRTLLSRLGSGAESEAPRVALRSMSSGSSSRLNLFA